MVDLARIASNLSRRDDGIWVSPGSASVSYPEEGSRRCLAVEEAGSFWFEHRNACILEALRAFPPVGAIFDVGGGNGFVSLALQDAGFDVVLVEPGERAAANARDRGVRTVVCSTLEGAGIEPGTVSAVGLFDVVEHLEDDLGFLRGVARGLGPGGQVYVTVPAYSFLWSSEDDYAGHRRRYTLGRLGRVLRGAGFTVRYQTYFFALLPLPILLLRTLPSRLGLRGIESRGREAREHRAGPLAGLLERMLDLELRAIRAGMRLPVGGSCLVVAQAMA